MRVKLCDKYKIEREDICKKIIDILKLDTNNSFLLSELDDDTEKQIYKIVNDFLLFKIF